MISTLDETVKTGVLQRAKAATKQQVYVTMDVTLAGKESFAKKVNLLFISMIQNQT